MTDFSIEKQPLDQVILITTAPDAKTAEALARSLVAKELVACVNCFPAGTSVYRWQGRVETAAEVVMLIKTVREYGDRVARQVQDEHPYELPEVLVVPVIGGSRAYLDWVADAVQPTKD